MQRSIKLLRQGHRLSVLISVLAPVSLLGTTYGGNGTTTFALPDLRGVAPNKLSYSICFQGLYPVAQ